MTNNTIDNVQKTALVTGASRGIGLAIAKELSADHRLVLACSSDSSAEVLRQDFPDATVVAADLNDVDGIEAAFGQVDLSELDVLVHSAGVHAHYRMGEVTVNQWREVLNVNVIAVSELTRMFLPALRRAKGMVVMINSGAGYFAGAGYGPYAASKHALTGMTDALREEERGVVRVTSIHPGKVDSDMQRELQKLGGNDDYDGAVYVRPQNVARATRLAVDTSPETTMETITVRPVVK